MHLYITNQAPHHWITVNEETNSVVDEGIAESLTEVDINKSIKQVIMVLEGSQVTSHQVSVPGNSRKKVISAIPFVLEEELTDDIEDLHFALQQWSADEPAQVLVTKDTLIRDSLDQFEQAGITVDDMVPEYLLLPRHPSTDLTLARSSNGDFMMRKQDGSGTVMDENMLELWWDMEAKDKNIAINDEQMVKDLIAEGWENIQFWKIGDTFSDWIANGGLNNLTKPCLLQGKYDDTGEKQTRFDYKMAANFMLAGVAIYIGSLLANYFYLSYSSNRLNTQAVEVFETAFPELSEQTIEDPVYEMRKGIGALRSGNYQSDNFLSIFQVVANQIKGSANTRLNNLIFEDDVLKAQVIVPDFSALDALSTSLSVITQGYATVETKDAGAQDDVVQGVLEVTLIQG